MRLTWPRFRHRPGTDVCFAAATVVSAAIEPSAALRVVFVAATAVAVRSPFVGAHFTSVLWWNGMDLMGAGLGCGCGWTSGALFRCGVGFGMCWRDLLVGYGSSA
ncbi:hypothetical protein EJ02DRAFT_231238 [Clathrospora elynae]|uniref:Uncharacterized protein n=1 Tax=Clathrospora elynae TaxID=706981 RepID=A0A6A5SI16_9PLEO|nr:hypothetical protein EJ02DRAFT_231238 [Clathrospora elynae]